MFFPARKAPVAMLAAYVESEQMRIRGRGLTRRWESNHRSASAMAEISRVVASHLGAQEEGGAPV
eukprot:6269565-Alexandrium_andersonii.AAC.1